MNLCADCHQQKHIIGSTARKVLPVEVCGCDVAPVWLLVDWQWRLVRKAA